MSFLSFINELLNNPISLLVVILLIITIAMNGAMDAPNAIATSVSTRSLYIDHALLMSTACNFIGVLIVSIISPRVSYTIYNLVDFTTNEEFGLIALLSALLGIIIWGIITWSFNIPSSSSHSLIAGLIGSSIALNKGISGINFASFSKILIGILISIFIAYFLGMIIVKIIISIFKNKDRRDSKKFFDVGQIISGALMSIIHGAQDGQKFIGIFMILIYFLGHNPNSANFLPIWVLLVCAIVMGIGTSFGVRRVVKSVGMNVVNLETYEGFAADIASFISILIATILGIPLSTTQTATTSIMGVGASKRKSNVNWSYAKYLSITWFLTYPLCGIISYGITKLLMIF